MATYRDFVAPDGTICLPTMEQYAAKVDPMNSRTKSGALRSASVRSAKSDKIWRNIGPNRTYQNNNGVVSVRTIRYVCSVLLWH